MAVEQVFYRLNIDLIHIELGAAELFSEPYSETLKIIQTELEALGFEIIDDRHSRLIEKIKNIVIHLVHHSDTKIGIKLSFYLSDNLNFNYKYISKLFSEIEGITIEQYYILQKIEKVKELLVYDDQTLSEIAYMLEYSSVAALSNQFKKVTGLTPSHFKKIKEYKRKPLDKVE
ncbi:MAG: AraC family transcriptional regulator [Candidatus Kapabacteria bacterium]|nr:AraC family transcriptional regulator [Candidatus Kapabacteria bacterium]